MPWKPSEQRRIIEDFWQNGESICPDCGTTIVPQLSTAGQAQLHASCPQGCGSFSSNRDQDPRRASFRPWLGTEVPSLFERYPAFCPVDGSQLELSNVDGNPKVTCHRCGNSAVKPPARVRKSRKWTASKARRPTRDK